MLKLGRALQVSTGKGGAAEKDDEGGPGSSKGASKKGRRLVPSPSSASGAVMGTGRGRPPSSRSAARTALGITAPLRGST